MSRLGAITQISIDIKHTSNGIVKCKLGQVAGLVGRVEDFVVEDGKVKSQSKTDGVGRSKICLSNLGGSLISLKRGIGGGLAAVTDSELREVSVVIALPGRTLAKCALPYLV